MVIFHSKMLVYQRVDTVPAITTQSQVLPASKQCCETNLPLLYPQRIQEAPRLASVQAEAVIGDHEDSYPNVDPNNFNSPHHLRSISISIFMIFHHFPSFSIISESLQQISLMNNSSISGQLQANFWPSGTGRGGFILSASCAARAATAPPKLWPQRIRPSPSTRSWPWHENVPDGCELYGMDVGCIWVNYYISLT